MMRARTLACSSSLNALTTTVTPVACPWGFNPNNRQPTAMESAKHFLCLMEQDIANGVSWIDQEMLAIWNQLSQWWSDIWNGIKQGAEQLWQGVQQLWNRWQQAWAQFTNGVKLIAIAAAIGIGVYVAYRLDKK